MRNDLTRACVPCRARFSARLESCPVCSGPALSVSEALARVPPRPWTQWLIKWMVLFAVAPTGVLFVALFLDYGLEWVPDQLLTIAMLVLTLAVSADAAILIVGVPAAILAGIVWLVAGLGTWVCRRVGGTGCGGARLRVLLDREPRHRPRRLGTLDADQPQTVGPDPKHGDGPRAKSRWRRYLVPLVLLFATQLTFDLLFGFDDMLTNATAAQIASVAFLSILLTACILPAVVLLLSIAWAAIKLVHRTLMRPPPLLAGPSGAIVRNDALLITWRRDRTTVVGRAEPLSREERDALATPEGRQTFGLEDGRACLALRVRGRADGEVVDDAWLTPLAVETDEGRRFVVEARDAVLALEVDIDATHAPSLAAHIVDAAGLPGRSLDLRCGAVVPGTRVRVTADPGQLSLDQGYRTRRSVDLLASSERGPVVIENE